MIYLQKREIKGEINFFVLATLIMTIKILLSFTGLFKLPDIIDNIMIISSIIFFIIDIFNNKYCDIYKNLVNLIFGTIVFYTCIVTKNYYLFMSYLLIVASINKNIRKIIILLHNIKILYIAFLIPLYVAFCITDNYLSTEVVKNGHIALSLGFVHANVAGIILFWMIVEKIYLNYKNNNLNMRLKLLFQIILIYLLTACKTVILMGLLLWILLIINKRKVTLVTKILAKYVFSISSIFIVLSTNIYMKGVGVFYNLIQKIDLIITGRIRIGAKLLSIYDWTFFGQNVQLGIIDWDSYYRLNSITVDGMYIDFFIRSGIIYILIIGILILKYFREERPYIDYIIVILFSIYGLSEIHGVYTAISFPLILIVTDYFKKYKNIDRL